MLQEIQSKLAFPYSMTGVTEGYDLEKAQRYLCFVQGVLVDRGLCSIDDMRGLNDPDQAAA